MIVGGCCYSGLSVSQCALVFMDDALDGMRNKT